MMEKDRVIPKGIVWPFFLLTILFFAWAVPNNLTDTMLAAFKRILSLSDSKTAWIQIVCYFLGYGCLAIPAAMFIKRFTYKSGVMFGIALYALGTFLFYPAKLVTLQNPEIGFFLFLFAIFILFSGLSILETSANSYVLALGSPETATRRLNFSQSFNPFGAITGVLISQIFILSQLDTSTAAERAAMSEAELMAVQSGELTAVTNTYMILGAIMVVILAAIWITRMPDLKEDDKTVDLKGSLGRLLKNKYYVWSVVAQFFYMGAQIAVWSFIIRYSMVQLNLDGVVAALGEGATQQQIIEALRNVEPFAAGFYNIFEAVGLDALLPRTAEQAGATYYIMSLVLFVVMRFVCTGLMTWIKDRKILTTLAVTGMVCCLIAVYSRSALGVYALMCVSGCMSLMFPTIYGIGVANLGEDTKFGGAGMVMAIAGAAVLTQIQGLASDATGSIQSAYWVPVFAFAVVAYFGAFVAKKAAANK